MNHQQYIEAVAAIAIDNLPEEDRKVLPGFKLAYGAGAPFLRGVTYFGRWQNGHDTPDAFVEVCASGESDPVQLAGTTIHEVAHVLAGYGAGHEADWHAACEKLGLRRVKAAGTFYVPAHFAPAVRERIGMLPLPNDGRPVNGWTSGPLPRFQATAPPPGYMPKPCSSTHGCKGGKSRGKGSGSRMLKAVCGDCGYTIRLTRKWAEAGMPTCCCGGSINLEV